MTLHLVENTSTQYAGSPRIHLGLGSEDALDAFVSYALTPDPSPDAEWLTLRFEKVVQLGFVDAEFTYSPTHRIGLLFALAEVSESPLIDELNSHSLAATRTGDGVFFPMRHFRFGFDDLGTLDILAEDAQIRRGPLVHLGTSVDDMVRIGRPNEQP